MAKIDRFILDLRFVNIPEVNVPGYFIPRSIGGAESRRKYPMRELYLVCLRSLDFVSKKKVLPGSRMRGRLLMVHGRDWQILTMGFDVCVPHPDHPMEKVKFQQKQKDEVNIRSYNLHFSETPDHPGERKEEQKRFHRWRYYEQPKKHEPVSRGSKICPVDGP
jgi:hypothetical protein